MELSAPGNIGINFKGKRIMPTGTDKKQRAGKVMAVTNTPTFKNCANKGIVSFAVLTRMLRLRLRTAHARRYIAFQLRNR